MNMANLTMLASVMASLVAVPAVSTSMTSDIDAAGALVAGTSEEAFSDSPRQYTTTVGTDTVERTIDTAAGEASFSISNDRFEAELDRPGETTRLVQEAGTMERHYAGSGVAITSTEGATTEEWTCETADGVISVTYERGDRTESFTGIDRSTVEQTCEDARETLSDRAERLASVATELDVMAEQVEITGLNASAEHVEITNTGPIPIELGGWSLHDGSGDRYTFENGTLASGESVKVYSADAYDDCETYCWSSTYVWSQDGDTARLDDPNGDRVDSYSYGG